MLADVPVGLSRRGSRSSPVSSSGAFPVPIVLIFLRIARRPNRANAGLRRTFGPGGVNRQHCQQAVAVFLGTQQRIASESKSKAGTTGIPESGLFPEVALKDLNSLLEPTVMRTSALVFVILLCVSGAGVRSVEPEMDEDEDVAQRTINEIVSGTLASHGFRQVGDTCYRDEPESTLVVWVQQSGWSDVAYINFGVYFRSLGQLERPKLGYCHINARLEELVPNPSRLTRLLNFNLVDGRPDATDEERRSEIPALLGEYGIPWMESVRTLELARETLTKHNARGFVLPEARLALGVT